MRINIRARQQDYLNRRVTLKSQQRLSAALNRMFYMRQEGILHRLVVTV
jgi:hypothetical protein